MSGIMRMPVQSSFFVMNSDPILPKFSGAACEVDQAWSGG